MVAEPEMRSSEADINQLNVMNQKKQIEEDCLHPGTQQYYWNDILSNNNL